MYIEVREDFENLIVNCKIEILFVYIEYCKF